MHVMCSWFKNIAAVVWTSIVKKFTNGFAKPPTITATG